MVSVPVRLPVAVGVKVTRIAQLLSAARVVPQLLVWLKSPVTAMPLMLRGAPPVFVNVICEARLGVLISWLPKFNAVSERDAAGTTPVPLKFTVCWVPKNESSVTVSTPLRLPVAVGLKVMLIGQLVFGARVVPQLLVWLKSPVIAKPLIVSVSVPAFRNVTT